MEEETGTWFYLIAQSNRCQLSVDINYTFFLPYHYSSGREPFFVIQFQNDSHIFRLRLNELNETL